MVTFQSKITPPKRQAKTLRRVRLLDILHNNIHRKVVFVCAPAGYGKTTLLVDFAEDVDANTYWYRIGTEDADLSVFYENLILAFKYKNPTFGENLNPAGESRELPAASLARSLVNEIQSQLDDFSLLFLDDFHNVSMESEITDFIEALVEYLPDRLRLVFGSRTVYGIPTALLYVQEQLAIISEEDLKFRPSEIKDLCRVYYKIQLTDQQAEAIREQAEGWIVAILLTLRSDNLTIEIPKIIGAKEHIYTYLADEVIDRLPQTLIHFMHATSLVEEFSVSFANYVMDISNAEEIIKQLNDLNLFLGQSSESENTYRFHQLFSEFLRGHFQQTRPDEIPVAHLKIAQWYEKNGKQVDAIPHYLEAGQSDEAAVLINRVARDIYLSGQIRTLENWYDTLSENDSLLSLTPELLLNLAKTKITHGDYQIGGDLLDRAELVFKQENDHASLVNLLVTRGMMLRFTGKYQSGYDLACEIQFMVDEYDLDRYYWYQAERLKGICVHFLGDPKKAIEYLTNAAQQFRTTLKKEFANRQAHELLMTLADIGYFALSVGNIFEAQKSYLEAVDLTKKMRGNYIDIAMANNNIAYLHFLLGKYYEAWKYYLQAMEISKNNDLKRYSAFILNGQADVLREIGEKELAYETYLQAQSIADHLGEAGALAEAFSGLADVEMDQGLFNQAMFYLREIARVQQGDINSPPYQVRFAKIYYLMGQTNLALKAFYQAFTHWGEPLTPNQQSAEALFYYSLALQASQNQTQAADKMQQALEIVALLGYDQFLVNAIRANLENVQAIAVRVGSRQMENLIERASTPLPTLKQLVSQVETETLEDEIYLHVSAFNQENVRLNGVYIQNRVWSSVGARALFFYILDRKQVRKEEIALEFWPDFSTSKVNSNFHATLWRVRNALGIKNIISFEDDHYQINPHVHLYYDAAEFDLLIQQIKKTQSIIEKRTFVRQAIELYQGDFLPGIDMPWADERRRDLQFNYLNILSDYADDCFEKHSFSEALESYQQIVQLEPYQEPSHLKIMQCLTKMGEKNLALLHFHEYSNRLAEELRLSPGSELLEFIETLH